MNVRSVIIASTPMFSTHAGFSRVTLPCEPWNKPETPVAKPLNQSVAATIRREDAAIKIIAAIKAGNGRFDEIAQAAFGKRNGHFDDLARTVLAKLLSDGTVTRYRSDLPGLPFIWKLADA